MSNEKQKGKGPEVVLRGITKVIRLEKRERHKEQEWLNHGLGSKTRNPSREPAWDYHRRGDDPEVRKSGGTVTEERDFVGQWWQHKFSMPNLPRLDEDVIMFAHALELLTAYQGVAAAEQMTTRTAKHWLEGWWLRKFEANPPKHGSVLSLADAEQLLIEFRKSITQPRDEKS